jgi:predicted transcriptional regulator
MKGLNLYSPTLSQKHATSKFLNLGMKYRSSFEVIASILEAIRNDGVGQYAIMTHAGISHSQFKKYLESLAEIGLVEMKHKEDRILYRTSEKGLYFLDQYYVLLEMLFNVGVSGGLAGIPGSFGDRVGNQGRSPTSAILRWMR